nr:reverse transcriptase domain-containing protein [Tanacetum cinerariifolium]
MREEDDQTQTLIEQEEAFQTLKDNLCNVPILSLPDRSKDFEVYYDASNQGEGYCDASNQGLRCVLMQRGKANIVAELLSRKERVKQRRIRAMSVTIQSSVKDKILVALGEASKVENAPEMLRDVRKMIMDEAHTTKYSINPGADKMYYNLRDMYWWPGMNKDIVTYVTIREYYKMEKLARLYIDEIAARHGVPVSIISGHGGRFTLRFWKTLQKALGIQLDMKSWLIRPKLVQLTIDKVVLIKERLKAARDRQKSYVDNRRSVPNIVEPEIRSIQEVAPMADRTMEELLQAPTKGDSVSKTDDRIDKLADQNFELSCIVNKQVITPATAKAVKKTYVICGGAHAYYDCISTDSNQPSVYAATGTYNQVSPPNRASHQIPPLGFALNNQGYRVPMNNTLNFQNQGFQNQPFQVPNNQIHSGIPNELSHYMKSNEIMIKSMQNQINVLRGDFNKQEENLKRNLNNDMRSILGNFFQNQASTSGTLSSNIVPKPKGEMKAVTTRSGLAYEGPSIPTNSPLEKVVERDTQETTEKEHSKCQGSTAQIQPPIVPISISERDVSRTQPKPTIPYPSRLNDQNLHEKATNQMEKFFQIFHDLHFDISFANALLLMPKFASTIKSLLTNKDKLFELVKVPLNENCSAMLLKKIPKKLGDPELTPTRMTLELADRSITHPKGVAEDVFVKVGKFHFPTDFMVVDFEADPRVPLILGRSFLRTGRALIDVYGEEITLRVNDESVTLYLNQNMRYSSTYDDNSVNRVDVIDIACEEFVQDVLDLLHNFKSSNPTLVSNPSNYENDFYFLNDESIPTGIDKSFYDLEGDIIYLEKLLNEEPFQLLSIDLKQAEETKEKSSIEEPPELELKELPSHLKYAFLEDTNKLPVIIAKDLKDVEKEALIKVLKSHKRAIAWKISDIKGIDPRFCTHKILMEEDYKPVVQSQRRVNPKIHDVIKKEVIKLLDAGMIYPISDSPWVSPIHCVPKKGGITIVANENNELIPTRLVTDWRVCIDYRKLNDATRKDHFPLPFMD